MLPNLFIILKLVILWHFMVRANTAVSQERSGCDFDNIDGLIIDTTSCYMEINSKCNITGKITRHTFSNTSFNNGSYNYSTCQFNFTDPIHIGSSADVQLLGRNSLVIYSTENIIISSMLSVKKTSRSPESDMWFGGFCSRSSLNQTFVSGSGPGGGRSKAHKCGSAGHGGMGYRFERDEGIQYGWRYGYNLTHVDLIGGSSGGLERPGSEVTCGGGVISISSNKNITLDANISTSAFSFSFNNGSSNTSCIGGSSGGTIVITANEVILGSNSFLSSKGTFARSKYGIKSSGSGGVIMINATKIHGPKPDPHNNTGLYNSVGENGVVIINGESIGRFPEGEITENYAGCYRGNISISSELPDYKVRPVFCKKRCRCMHRTYAILHEKTCVCLQTIDTLTLVNTTLCSLRCFGRYNFFCGGKNGTDMFYTVYRTENRSTTCIGTSSSPITKYIVPWSPTVRQSRPFNPMTMKITYSSPMVKQTTSSGPMTKQTMPYSQMRKQTTYSSPMVKQTTYSSQMTKKTTPYSQMTKKTTPSNPMTKQTTYFSPMTKQTTYFSPMTKQTTYFSPMTKQTTYFSPMTKQTTYFSPMTKQTTYFSPMTKQTTYFSPMTKQTTYFSPMTKQTTYFSPMTKQTTYFSPMTKQTTYFSPMTEQTTPYSPMTKKTTTFNSTTKQTIYSGPMRKQTTSSSPMTKQTTPFSPMTKQTTPSNPMTKQTTPSNPMTKQTIPSGPMTKQTTPSGPMTKQTIPSGPMTKQTTPSGPMTKQTIPSGPITKQTISSNPITKQTTYPGPMTKQTTPSSPMTKQTTFFGPMTKQTTPSGPMTKQTIPSGPITKQTISSNPITKQTTYPGPMTKQTTPSSPITKPITSSGPITKPITSSGPITKPITSSGPITKPITSSGPITKPITSSGPITKPITSSGPITKPITSSGPITKPITSSGPITKPITSSGPITKPITSSGPITKPITSSGPTVKPTTRDSIQDLASEFITKENYVGILKKFLDFITGVVILSPSDLNSSLSIFETIIERNVVSTNSVNESKHVGQIVLNIADVLLSDSHLQSWNNLEKTPEIVLKQVEDIVKCLGSGLFVNETLNMNSTKFGVHIQVFDPLNFRERNYTISGLEIQERSANLMFGVTKRLESIFIPRALVNSIKGTKPFSLNLLKYQPSAVLIKAPLEENRLVKKSLVSDIIAVSLNRPLSEELKDDIILSFPGTKNGEMVSRRSCRFLDFSHRSKTAWSKEGCQTNVDMFGNTKCSYDHFTHFAVLLKVDNTKIGTVHIQTLMWISNVGCGISLLCLILTLITFVFLKNLTSEHTMIHCNLALSLTFAQIVFLLGIRATEQKIACKITAILLHYFYTVSFCWMAVEGIHLYRMVVKVFIKVNIKRLYYVFGWGAPAFLVAIFALTNFDGYGNERACWLSIKSGLIWAFVGPVLIILLINLIILILVIRVMFVSINTIPSSAEASNVRTSIRGIVSLLPLLGLTWLFGVLAVNRATLVFQYIFTILNSLQGFFIFMFHCVLNSEVRAALKRHQQKSTLRRSWYNDFLSKNKKIGDQSKTPPFKVNNTRISPDLTVEDI